MQEAIVIDTPAGIEGVRLCSLKGRLKLEMAGLKFRGGSTFAFVKRQFGFKGNKASVLRQFEAFIADFNKQHGFTKEGA